MTVTLVKIGILLNRLLNLKPSRSKKARNLALATRLPHYNLVSQCNQVQLLETALLFQEILIPWLRKRKVAAVVAVQRPKRLMTASSITSMHLTLGCLVHSNLEEKSKSRKIRVLMISTWTMIFRTQTYSTAR